MENTLRTSTIFTHPVTVHRGEIWRLGNHYLMCGDCTNAQDVARLFQGQTFALCFTSPPYTNQRSYKVGSFNWNAMMCGAFDQMVAHGQPDCHILVNLGLSHKNRQVDMYWMEWIQHCGSMGWPVFGWYVWDKMSACPRENDGRLSIFHEFIFHFNVHSKPANKWLTKKDESINRRSPARYRLADGSMRDATGHMDTFRQPFKIPNSVIRIMSEQTRGIHTSHHPAVFPVGLPGFIMQTWSQTGDIVYEPFCGSGTSIIAAENLHRQCYAMEIESTYCELAIQRWQEQSNQQAYRVEVSA